MIFGLFDDLAIIMNSDHHSCTHFTEGLTILGQYLRRDWCYRINAFDYKNNQMIVYSIYFVLVLEIFEF